MTHQKHRRSVPSPRIDHESVARVLMLGTSPEMRGGVASVVATLRDAGLFERWGVQYVATHVEGSRLRKVGQFLAAAVTFITALRLRATAVVHAHVSSNGSFWRKAILLWFARRFDVATIVHLHSGNFAVFAENGFGGPLLRRCIRETLESSSMVIVLSPRWGDWVRGFAPRSRVRVIGNPVRCPEASALLPIRRSAGQPGRILYLGNVCAEKGTFDLLDAFVNFAATHPGWRLVIGGKGEVERLMAAAEACGVRDRVDFLGWVSGAQKDHELSIADVFVLPSYSEGMPVSVLEAMAFGAAVITTPVGGVPDMMQADVHGLWVEPGDVKGLAERLSGLASSPEWRMKLGAAAREHVLGTYSAQKVVSQVCRAYEDAIATRTR